MHQVCMCLNLEYMIGMLDGYLSNLDNKTLHAHMLKVKQVRDH